MDNNVIIILGAFMLTILGFVFFGIKYIFSKQKKYKRIHMFYSFLSFLFSIGIIFFLFIYLDTHKDNLSLDNPIKSMSNNLNGNDKKVEIVKEKTTDQYKTEEYEEEFEIINTPSEEEVDISSTSPYTEEEIVSYLNSFLESEKSNIATVISVKLENTDGYSNEYAAQVYMTYDNEEDWRETAFENSYSTTYFLNKKLAAINTGIRSIVYSWEFPLYYPSDVLVKYTFTRADEGIGFGLYDEWFDEDHYWGPNGLYSSYD